MAVACHPATPMQTAKRVHIVRKGFALLINPIRHRNARKIANARLDKAVKKANAPHHNPNAPQIQSVLLDKFVKKDCAALVAVTIRNAPMELFAKIQNASQAAKQTTIVPAKKSALMVDVRK